MLRSFLLSNLRRHDCRSVAQPLGRRLACWSKSRGYAQPAADEKRHLYMVLDDWEKGFSIHKLDLDKDDGGGNLPLPAPVHRQEKEHVTGSRYKDDRSEWNFATLGSKIIAAGALDHDEDGVTLMYDTKTAGLSAVPRLPPPLRCSWTLAAAVGNGLYVLEPNSERDRGWNAASFRRESEVVGNGMHRLDAPDGNRHHWTWCSLPSILPFNVHDIESSVVHLEEGGRWGTLFVSVGQWDHKPERHDGEKDFTCTSSETFSYVGAGQWRRHGEWDLPFCGQGQYDGELDTWVGLHKKHGPASCPHYYGDIGRHTDGYLCSSDVVSLEGSTSVQPPPSKLCGERLFDPGNVRHVGASLVYMGDSTYCLVEVEAIEKFQTRSAGNKSAIHLAVFRLKYGKNGELTITARRPDRSYLFSRFDENTKVRAFWM